MHSLVLLLLAIFGLSNCSIHTGFLEYENFVADVAISASPIANATDLGPIFVSTGAPIWKDCSEEARTALSILANRAKALGANAIGDILWLPNDRAPSTVPICKKQWGWFAIWPVVLTPLFMKVQVSARAYKVNKGVKKSAGLYQLPKDDAELPKFIATFFR